MKELIEHMARSLVDKPDEVSVHVTEGAKTTVFELTVAKDNVGQVVGHGGRLSGAMRTILYAVAKKENTRVVLEILE